MHTHYAHMHMCVQALKCLALREDLGKPICGGADPVEYLCAQEGLLLHLLGMLYTLQVRSLFKSLSNCCGDLIGCFGGS